MEFPKTGFKLKKNHYKNFETDFKVSSQSRKFEFNVFSITHLNGNNL